MARALRLTWLLGLLLGASQLQAAVDFEGDYALYGRQGSAPATARLQVSRDAAGALRFARVAQGLLGGEPQVWTTEEVRETPLGTSLIVTYRVPAGGGVSGALTDAAPGALVRGFYRVAPSGELRESLIHSQPGGRVLPWQFGRLVGRRLPPALATQARELRARLAGLEDAAVFALPGHGAADLRALTRLLQLRDRAPEPAAFVDLTRARSALGAAIGALTELTVSARGLRANADHGVALLLGATPSGDLLLVRARAR